MGIFEEKLLQIRNLPSENDASNAADWGISPRPDEPPDSFLKPRGAH